MSLAGSSSSPSRTCRRSTSPGPPRCSRRPAGYDVQVAAPDACAARHRQRLRDRPRTSRSTTSAGRSTRSWSPAARAPGRRYADDGSSAWLAAAAPRARRVTSVCTGAFLLARAGLLDGRRATTHWAGATRSRARYPSVDRRPRPDLRRATATSATSAGVTAGMDLALALVEEDLGPRASRSRSRATSCSSSAAPAARRSSAPSCARRPPTAPRCASCRRGSSTTSTRTSSVARARRARAHERAPLRARVQGRDRPDARRLRRAAARRARPAAAREHDRRAGRRRRRRVRLRHRRDACAARSRAASASAPSPTASASPLEPPPPGGDHHGHRHPDVRPLHRARRDRALRGALAPARRAGDLARARARASCAPTTACSRSRRPPRFEDLPAPRHRSSSPAAPARATCSTTSGCWPGCAARTRRPPGRPPSAPGRCCSAPPGSSTACARPATGSSSSRSPATARRRPQERVVFAGQGRHRRRRLVGDRHGPRARGRIAGDDYAQAIQLLIEYDPQPPYDCGSTAKAGPELTELVRSRVAAVPLARAG